MLDVRLVSVLSGNLDLAARLIPKLHAVLDEDNDSVDCTVTDPTSDHHTSHQGGWESKGKETASGGCSSGRANQYSPSGSSPGKRGRGSGGVNGQNKGDKPSKKPRNDSAGNSGEDSNENPGQREGDFQNDIAGSHTNGPFFNQQNRTSDPPEDDPGPADLFVSGDPPEWACHFHKRDHITYGPWNRKYASCFCSPRKQLRRIKHHFEIVHKPIQCNCCSHIFQSHAELTDHCQETFACLKGSLDLKEGINGGQWDAIEDVLSRQGHKKVDDFSRWYAIWRILFPGLKQPSNPWKERPASFQELDNFNTEECLLKLRTIVDQDVRSGVLPDGRKVHDRYQCLFRKILEEEIASRDRPRHWNLFRTLENSDFSMNPQILQDCNSIQPQIGPLDEDWTYSHQIRRLSQSNLALTEGFLNTFRESGSSTEAASFSVPSALWPDVSANQITTNEPNGLLCSTVNPALIHNYNSIHTPIKPLNDNSIRVQQSRPFSEGQVAFAEGFLDEFLSIGFPTAVTESLECPDLPLPESNTTQNATTEANAPSDNLILDHNQGGDQIMNVLDTENEMPTALAAWK
ncbi:hypothetical protein L207DRAFT_189309 [Hyaloscypha variabilis F]|uniref:C2H2-type domain-containing protein n=1 Tax=Hyaloscypha variabilis (strain UAMH 11265 / GT02V1 / F) TaxID=1149755 RepID=A0A2J6QYZ6_HYAVF|nr:hypothetical protein L207DRAFT_189309 [Hyaloscypha variabilis F]